MGKQGADGSTIKHREDTLKCVQMIRAVPFPRDAQKELAGMVHPAIDGKDFCPLHKTDAAFLMFDGSEKTVQDIIGVSEDVPPVVYPFLINEASYYEKDIA